MTEPGVSLSTYKSFAVPPASNESGQATGFDFTSVFTQDLKSVLQAKGYNVVADSAPSSDTLLVKCAFINYDPGNAFQRWLLPGLGQTQATVKTSLVDAKDGHPVGDLVTTEVVTGGFLGGVGGYSSVLASVANDIATAIDRKIKG